MRVLVTGSTGFLGASVVQQLLVRGATTVRCHYRSDGRRPQLERLAAERGVALEWCHGSLTDAEVCRTAMANVDVVCHVAAALRGAPADMILNSVVATERLLQFAGPRTKVVLVSSFGVYGVSERPRGSLVDESTPLEPHPEQRDPYSFSKLWQETVARESQRQRGFQLITLRPGVIYGPGGPAMSGRVGLEVFGRFLHIGGRNVLPLTYVENCADAIAAAAMLATGRDEVYNVVDDGLPTCAQFLRWYRRNIAPLKVVRVPYGAMQLLARMVVWYHRRSRGQLPAIFTPYKVAATWKGNRFSNAKMKSLEWTPKVTIAEGLRRVAEAAQ